MKRLLLVCLLIGVLLIVGGCGNKVEEPEPPPIDEPQLPQEPQQPPQIPVVERVDPVAVMINNHSAARPHSGLAEASIVYEFLVEGGITRLLAVYDKPLTEDFIVGPVRSLRPYFAKTAMEHGGIIAHSGYSERTKEMIAGLGLKEIVSSTYLYRDSSRNAPHNLYTSLERLYRARGESTLESETVEPAMPGVDYTDGSEIEIRYHSSNIVRYEYDRDADLYLRFVNGTLHTDRKTGKQYGAKRVIVRQNKHTNVPDSTLVDIDVSGSGTAELYEDGNLYELTWEKTDRTRYYYTDGSEVDLRLGNTWIQVVR